MDIKTISVALAIVTVSAVIFGALLPMFQDVTATEDTFTNEGYYRMSNYDASAEHTVVWTQDNHKTVTVDGVDVPIDISIVGSQITLIADTNFLVRYNLYADGATLTFVGGSGGTYTASTSATITMSGGTCTAVMDANTRTSAYTNLYLPSLDGPYVMKKADTIAYLNGDSEIFAYGLTRVKNSAGGNTGSPGFGLEFSGSYDSGITDRIWRNDNTAPLSLSDVSLNVAKNDKFVDLYIFESITATGTLTETIDDQQVTTSSGVTYTYIIVPYQVAAERVVTVDGPTGAVIDLIPLIVALSIVILAVGWFITRKL